ncbi:hypothetical protein ACFWMX_31650 [Streptomyces sp. NPDC058378]|uniref:hypothetical protein n=1 Tax=Streptomyces sp. NPDC058378 TaxID=3346469 RepID=UPI00365269BA
MEHPLPGRCSDPVREILSAATGLPVHVDSHARALARAEQMFGEVSTRRSTVLLFIGAVVDGAFATSGEVHRGHAPAPPAWPISLWGQAGRADRTTRSPAVSVHRVPAVRGVRAGHDPPRRRAGPVRGDIPGVAGPRCPRCPELVRYPH